MRNLRMMGKRGKDMRLERSRLAGSWSILRERRKG
jgi:hypothetical protein